VSDIAVLVDAMNRVTESECVLDPTIVSQLMKSREPSAPLNRLSAREMDTLALLAEGRSNTGIADRLGSVSQRSSHSAHKSSENST
jgi:DNA-binding NarL/FixJ family response regulator